MEDPTIWDKLPHIYLLAKERLEKGEKLEDILKDDSYKEKEKLFKEAVAKARLDKCDERSQFFVMTINLHGKSLGPGSANNRELLLIILLRNFPCDVIFAQDKITDKLTENIAREFDFEKRQNGKEAAIFWNKKIFKGTDEGLTELGEKITQFQPEIANLELDKRMCVVKLTCKRSEENAQGKNSTFLAVSWHGPNRKKQTEKESMTKEKKETIFQGLLKFVENVSEDEGNIPFIIGGDFNLDILDEKIFMPTYVTVASYPLSPKAERKGSPYIPCKDNFVVSDRRISVRWIRPIDFTSYNDEQTKAACDLSNQEQKEAKDIKVDPSLGVVDDLLDHDPVVAVMELSSVGLKLEF